MLVASFRFRALTTFTLVTLCLVSLGLYFWRNQGRRVYTPTIEPSTTCVLQIGIDEFRETYWLAESESKVAAESISVFTPEGEGIWGSRSSIILHNTQLITTKESGLDNDLNVFASLDKGKLACEGSYGNLSFNGTLHDGNGTTEGFVGMQSTHSCFASFPCRHRTSKCYQHPETLDCPETGKMKKDYEHGQCKLYLTEHFIDQDKKRKFDILINDPTGLDLVVDTISLTPNGNTTIQKLLESPLAMQIGSKSSSSIDFRYQDETWTKNGRRSNKACAVGNIDGAKNTRDSVCTFAC